MRRTWRDVGISKMSADFEQEIKENENNGSEKGLEVYAIKL